MVFETLRNVSCTSLWVRNKSIEKTPSNSNTTVEQPSIHKYGLAIIQKWTQKCVWKIVKTEKISRRKPKCVQVKFNESLVSGRGPANCSYGTLRNNTGEKSPFREHQLSGRWKSVQTWEWRDTESAMYLVGDASVCSLHLSTKTLFHEDRNYFKCTWRSPSKVPYINSKRPYFQ